MLPHGETGRPFTRNEPLLKTIRTSAGYRAQHYPHPQTKRGVARWQTAWQVAGCVRVEAPIVLEVYIRCARPASHFVRDGGLSSVGKHSAYPAGFDVSNVVKLVEDALKGLAMPDDAHIVAVHSCKRWVSRASEAGTFVTIRTAMNVDAPE